MITRKQSDLAALWGLFWRCFVFLPYMLGVFLVVGGIWFLRLILPLCALVRIFTGEFWPVLPTLAVWLLCVWVYRRFRLARFFEEPPSLL